MENNKIVVIADAGLSFKITDWNSDRSLDQLQNAVGGWIEIVHMIKPPHGLTQLLAGDALRLVAVVDEEGKIKNKRYNLAGTFIVGYPDFLCGYPDFLCGPIVIMKRGVNDDGEPDLLPLSDGEAEAVAQVLRGIGVREE